jgi:hypothetical protein
VTREALASTTSPTVEVTETAVDKAARRYVIATAAVVALGTAWYAAYLTVGAGTEAIAYIFVPVGGVLATACVYHMLRSTGFGAVALRF